MDITVICIDYLIKNYAVIEILDEIQNQVDFGTEAEYNNLIESLRLFNFLLTANIFASLCWFLQAHNIA